MKINRYKVLAAWMGAALLCTACHTDDTPESYPPANQAMRLYSEVATADEEDGTEGNNPVFLFWNYGDWLGQATNPVPLYVKKPAQDINTYNRPNAPYDTGELYPDGNRRVVATGYAPATLEPATRDDGTQDYEHLTIPKDGYCTTDVLTSITPLVASAALPFDRTDGEPLRFMHALSKVTFKAKLAEDMGKFLKNVRIKLDPTLVPVAVRWDRTNYTYKPEPGTVKSYFVNQLKDANSDDYYQLTSENPLTIGTAYIVTEKTELPVTITVARAESSNATYWKDVTYEIVLPFTIARHETDEWDQDKKENTLYANEAYAFTLVFGEKGIELVGNRCPWENGGYLIVPIYPVTE